MANTPYSQLNPIQFRGPDSTDYNIQAENAYKDLTVLYNRARLVEEDLREAYSRLVMDNLSLTARLQDLQSRVGVLEQDSNTLTFQNSSQIDNDLFNGTAFAIDAASQCFWDSAHGVITLPKVIANSLSKLYFMDQTGRITLPPTLDTNVLGAVGTADDTGALIDTSDPALAIGRVTGRIWQRNVIVGNTNADGAVLYLYIKAPQDLFTTPNSNGIIFHPFPSLGMDLLEVAITTNNTVLMADGDGYTPVNSPGYNAGVTAAIGWTAPGGWVGDAIINAGPRVFYFDPLPVTGVRLKMQQKNYFQEGGSYIYSYGSSNIDLRYDKFLNAGQIYIRFDAPAGKTITTVSNVNPQIYNIDPAQVPTVFSYKTVWETSFESGTYTYSPTPNSKRVWIQVELNNTIAGGTPALNGLSISYS